MTTRALHVSDLHVGRRDDPALAEALAALADAVAPELVLVTGDVSHRGRPGQLERGRALLEALGCPVLAVPGNHDLPHTLPARLTRPTAAFAAVFGTAEPAYRSDTLVVCGLDSTRPWRHQGGRLSRDGLRRAADVLRDPPPGALRVVALHHHLAGAPWRAARKFPLRDRERALAALAAAGAELIVGGHIHQCLVAGRAEFQATAEGAGSPVLVTAPGAARPRPHRSAEAQGAVVYEWDAGSLTVVPHTVADGRFVPGGSRTFARATLQAG